MSNGSTNNLNSEQLDEELVAYLDGELEPKAVQRVENLISADEQARRRLSQLATAWDLLEQLPRSAVDDVFTHTTVEMVALAAESEVAKQKAAEPAKRKMRWLSGGIAALAAAVVGFVAVALAVPDNNDPLLRDLPVVQNLDQYRAVGDLEFLKLLAKEPPFTSDATEPVSISSNGESHEASGQESAAHATHTGPQPASLSQPAPESIDARRTWVESLSASDKIELRANFERLAAMSAKEQAALRLFDKQLRADPHGDELARVVDRYYDWLKTLSPADRYELHADYSEESNPQKRIAQVKLDQERQVERQMSTRLAGRQIVLKDPDSQAALRWMTEFAAKHRDKIVLGPTDDRRGDPKNSDDRRPPRRSMALQSYDMWWSPTAPPGNIPPVTPNDLNELRAMLSKEKQAQLDKETGLFERVSMVRGWIQTAYREFYESAVRSAGRGGGFLSTAERIKRFERNLPADQREALQKLPEGERSAKLYDLWQKSRSDGQRGSGPGSPPRDLSPPDEPGGPRGFGAPGGPNGPPPTD